MVKKWSKSMTNILRLLVCCTMRPTRPNCSSSMALFLTLLPRRERILWPCFWVDETTREILLISYLVVMYRLIQKSQPSRIIRMESSMLSRIHKNKIGTLNVREEKQITQPGQPKSKKQLKIWKPKMRKRPLRKIKCPMKQKNRAKKLRNLSGSLDFIIYKQLILLCLTWV